MRMTMKKDVDKYMNNLGQDEDNVDMTPMIRE